MVHVHQPGDAGHIVLVGGLGLHVEGVYSTACECDWLLCEVITRADTAVDIITYIDKTCGVKKTS